MTLHVSQCVDNKFSTSTDITFTHNKEKQVEESTCREVGQKFRRGLLLAPGIKVKSNTEHLGDEWHACMRAC